MFLPTSRYECEEQGIKQVDFIIVSGDAYVDHPSFGVAIIGRTLQSQGFSVAILAQPNWNKDDDFTQFGAPRLGFLVTAGNIDSMVNHYSVNKKRREKDNYSDNGVMGKRPDRATIVYCQCIRRNYKDANIIIGGIEASLRRLAHYDYWDDKIRMSILVQSSADLLVYGMAEKTIVEIAQALDRQIAIKDLTYILGTVYKTRDIGHLYEPLILPSFDAIKQDKLEYCRSTKIQYENTDAINATTLVEPYPDGWFVVVNTPAYPLTTQEMDEIYALPFERTFHPRYQYIPAVEEIQFSIIANRGCFGGCAFCALTLHQGRSISSRSKSSLLDEAVKITEMPNFKGYIHDVGGPTANFMEKACNRQVTEGVCKYRQCLDPVPCKNLYVSHERYLDILQSMRKLPKIKKVFIRSGIRYDYLMLDKDRSFFSDLVEHHISGQLKVAPEHVSDKVLSYMRKPKFAMYQDFCATYQNFNTKFKKQQFLVPYLMSSHPGSTLDDAIELALYLKSIGHTPEQVQDFYPTPGTLATAMYYTEIDPLTMQPVYVAKTYHEKVQQRALIQYKYPKNHKIAYEALKEADRMDLVGYGPQCLVPPWTPPKTNKRVFSPKNKSNINKGAKHDNSK